MTKRHEQKLETEKLFKEELQSRISKNARVQSMLEKCSDTHAILIAETIAQHRLAGLETGSLDKMLKQELNKMFACTRMLYGRLPEVRMIKD